MTTIQAYRLPVDLRLFIVRQKQQSLPAKTIRENIKQNFQRSVSYSTIRNVWSRYLTKGSVLYKQPAGRPKALNAREERSLVRSFLANPGQSVRSVVKGQGERPIAQRLVSRQTVRRALRRHHLRPRVSQKGAEIKPKNKNLRLNFAKLHIDWTISKWSRVVFSDEATLFPKKTVTSVIWSGPQASRSLPFEEGMENKSINVWGYLRYDGTVRLFRFEGSMTKERYLDMLREHLDEAMLPIRRCESPLIFMQDNATYHTAQNVREWMTQNCPNIMAWPPQSPDLSPIENIWASIKNELWNRRREIRNSGDVWRISKEIAQNFTLVYT